MADDEEQAPTDRPDGFRPRRIRPKGWLEKAIADGSVRAPGAPDPDEGRTYTGTVIEPPVARIDQTESED